MRDFNQTNLDVHLSELAQNLTPDQAAQVKQRVQEKVSAANLDLSPDAVDGAFNLLGSLSRGSLTLPDLGGIGDRIANALSTLDPRQLGNLSPAGGEVAGQAADAVGGLLGGLGRVLGALPDLGGDLLGMAGDLGSSAGDFAESAGDLAGIIVEALGDVLGSLDLGF